MPPLHTSEADQYSPIINFSHRTRDTLGSLPKVRRPSMPHPLRRNQSERTYTQSIWLNDNPEEAKKPDKPPEPPPKKPPAPLLKRASEKSGIGTLTISTDIVENSFAEKDHEGNNPTEQPRSTTPSNHEYLAPLNLE